MNLLILVQDGKKEGYANIFCYTQTKQMKAYTITMAATAAATEPPPGAGFLAETVLIKSSTLLWMREPLSASGSMYSMILSLGIKGPKALSPNLLIA